MARVSPDSSWQEDAVLVRACLRGESGAWDRLVDRYRRLVFSVPLAMGLSREAAEDVFQEVFTKLLQHLGDLRREASLVAWLTTTARRESWRVSREAARGRQHAALDDVAEPAADDPGQEQAMVEIQQQHAVLLALEEIDEKCAALLRALYVEDPTPSYQEIAARLGRPVGSLGPTRSRCLGKLERSYRRLVGEDS